MDQKTALLATLVGRMVLAAKSEPERVDSRTARELAVLVRVLEKRLRNAHLVPAGVAAAGEAEECMSA